MGLFAVLLKLRWLHYWDYVLHNPTPHFQEVHWKFSWITIFWFLLLSDASLMWLCWTICVPAKCFHFVTFFFFFQKWLHSLSRLKLRPITDITFPFMVWIVLFSPVSLKDRVLWCLNVCIVYCGMTGRLMCFAAWGKGPCMAPFFLLRSAFATVHCLASALPPCMFLVVTAGIVFLFQKSCHHLQAYPCMMQLHGYLLILSPPLEGGKVLLEYIHWDF